MGLKPEQIAKDSEHSHQAAYFCWISQQKNCEPLQRSFAIPNGGLRNKVQAARLKAEGVKAGVADTFLPYPCGQYHGLWIEFKKPGTENLKSGGLSNAQLDFRNYCESVNYCYKVAYSWLQAAEHSVEYLSLK